MNARALFLSLFSLTASLIGLMPEVSSAAEGGSVPAPWKQQDVGAVEVKGEASFANGVFTLKGTLDTWGTNDGFHFVYQTVKGDGQIVARVVSVENTQNHAKAG